MAIKHIDYNGAPYVGQLVGQSINLLQPSSLPPRVVEIDIDWSQNQYSGGVVIVNINQQQIVNPIDVIQSIYIDNLGMILPVTVLFPDTGCEVECAPNSVIAQPVLTGQVQFIIFLGTTALSLSSLTNATTRVFVSNVVQTFLSLPAVPSAVAYFESSNNPGKPQNFISKPAGELHTLTRYTFANLGMTNLFNNNVILDIFGASQGIAALPRSPTSYLVITAIRASIENMMNWGSRVSGSYLLQHQRIQISLQDNNGVIFLLWSVEAIPELQLFILLEDRSDLNIPIDPFNATSYVIKTDVLQNLSPYTQLSGVSGSIVLDLGFTLVNKV